MKTRDLGIRWSVILSVISTIGIARAAPDPATIDSVFPGSGVVGEATTLRITGRNLRGIHGIQVGEQACQPVRVISDHELSCVIVPRAAGKFDLSAKSPQGASPSLADAFQATARACAREIHVPFQVKRALRLSDGSLPVAASVISGRGEFDPESFEFTGETKAGTTLIRLWTRENTSCDVAVISVPEIELSPTDKALAQGYVFRFSRIGGAAPFRFTVSPPEAGVIDATTGAFIPNRLGDAKITVTDSVGHAATSTVRIVAPLKLSPEENRVSAGDQIQFKAEHGVPPYHYTLISGLGTLNADSGLFVASEKQSQAVIRVTDSDGSSRTAKLDVRVPVEISPRDKTVSAGSELHFAAIGGTPPFRFSIKSSGSEAAKLDSEDGVFVASRAGDYEISVKDQAGYVSSAKVRVLPEAEIANRTLVEGEMDQITVRHGAPEYSFTLESGVGGLDPKTGRVSAIDRPGQMSVRAMDEEGTIKQVKLTVAGPLNLGFEKLQATPAQDLALSAHGGAPPYRYAIIGGKGWIDSGTGAFTAPEEPGMSIIRVTDSGGRSAEGTIEIEGVRRSKHPLALGSGHTCFFRDERIQCWGQNNHGQLGNGETKDSARPVTVKGIEGHVQAIASGFYHVCALINGGVRCWGDNSRGQLGVGREARAMATVPQAVPGLERDVIAVTAGQFHSCAIRSDGAYCWGANESGQLGNGSVSESSAPTKVIHLAGRIDAIAAGAKHSCALSNQSVFCWGDNSAGQLGNLRERQSVEPIRVASLTGPVSAVEAGGFQSCAVVQSKAMCWGYNGTGAIGARKWETRVLLSELETTEKKISALSLGFYHGCLNLEGNVRCWGYNRDGQVTAGAGELRALPSPVTGLKDVEALASGFDHNCALLKDGSVKCWGSNGHGQLGTGLSQGTMVPVVPVKLN